MKTGRKSDGSPWEAAEACGRWNDRPLAGKVNATGGNTLSRRARAHSAKGMSCCRGLTLIELIITLSILGILAALGVPAFDRMMSELRLNSAVDRFYAEILTTRSEAIKRGSTVIMCRTGDPLDRAGDGGNPRCGRNIQPGGVLLPNRDWSHGWLTYTTRPGFYGERNYTPADGDVLVGTGDVEFGRDDIDITSNNAGNSWLTFQGDGSLNEASLVRYAVCDSRGVQHGKLITIFMDGEARIDDLPTTTVTSCTPPA